MRNVTDRGICVCIIFVDFQNFFNTTNYHVLLKHKSIMESEEI